MKRHYLRFVAACLLLPGVLAACSGDPLQTEYNDPVNPYTAESRAFVAGLIDHATDFAEDYGGTYRDPGLILLEAMGSFEPLAVDIQVDELNRTLMQSLGGGASKGRSLNPFDDVPGLDGPQRLWLGKVLDVSAGVTSSAELKGRLTPVETQALRELGMDEVQPILALSGMLQAVHGYFTDPNEAPKIRTMLAALSTAAGDEPVARGPRWLQVQDAGPERPPPSFGDYFNPGTWWSDTLSDTRDVAWIGGVAGAGVGCAVGLVGLVAGCGIGAGGGGFLGGLAGTAIGAVVSGVANYVEATHSYNQAESAWCQEQSQLNSVLRHRDYASLCDPNQQ